MPRRLPDKTRGTERTGRFKVFRRPRLLSVPFPSAPVKVGQEIDVITKSGFALAEKSGERRKSFEN